MITKLILKERESDNGVIRRAVYSDLPKLVEVDCNCDSVVIKRLNASREQIEYTARLRLRDESKDFYVYELTDNYGENKIVGYATINFNNDNIIEEREDCELSWIAVKKQFQNKGIGKKLALFIEKVASAKRYKNICVKTSEIGNEKVRNFYLTLGYRKIKVTDEFYSDGTRAVLYRKELVH